MSLDSITRQFPRSGRTRRALDTPAAHQKIAGPVATMYFDENELA
jgi:hypothetical protein